VDCGPYQAAFFRGAGWVREGRVVLATPMPDSWQRPWSSGERRGETLNPAKRVLEHATA
jgi:hypothetical protein